MKFDIGVFSKKCREILRVLVGSKVAKKKLYHF